jgi:hypothetical protein
MSRITCRTPSTGKPLRITFKDVGDTLITIAEAPDFSIPDASGKFDERDPVDSSRAIRPGEVFFLTPLAAKNNSNQTETIEVYLLTEDNITITLGLLEIPAGDTGFIPVQGRSLLKRNASGTNGDRLQVLASSAAAFDVWCSAEEKLSSEHSGIEEL